MNRKSMIVVISIFLLMELLFSASVLEKKTINQYDDTYQISSIGVNTAGAVQSFKITRRVEPMLIFGMSVAGIVSAAKEKWLQKHFFKMEILFFLKQIRVAQQMDGKKRRTE